MMLTEKKGDLALWPGFEKALYGKLEYCIAA